jgi:hypothetical protein
MITAKKGELDGVDRRLRQREATRTGRRIGPPGSVSPAAGRPIRPPDSRPPATIAWASGGRPGSDDGRSVALDWWGVAPDRAPLAVVGNSRRLRGGRARHTGPNDGQSVAPDWAPPPVVGNSGHRRGRRRLGGGHTRHALVEGRLLKQEMRPVRPCGRIASSWRSCGRGPSRRWRRPPSS